MIFATKRMKYKGKNVRGSIKIVMPFNPTVFIFPDLKTIKVPVKVLPPNFMKSQENLSEL